MSYETPNYGGYTRAQRDVQYNHSRDSMTNAYGRFISQQRGNRSLGDMGRTFKRNYEPLKSSFGGRGLAGGGVQSGVQRQAMQNYVGDFSRDYGRAQTDLTQNLQQFDLNQMNLDAMRDNALLGIEEQRANDRANAAANVKYLQQMFGMI